MRKKRSTERYCKAWLLISNGKVYFQGVILGGFFGSTGGLRGK